jgi:antitoxin component of MazEF toxin-antitoxin module
MKQNFSRHRQVLKLGPSLAVILPASFVQQNEITKWDEVLLSVSRKNPGVLEIKV